MNRNDLVDMAYAIIELNEQAVYWKAEALHYQKMHEEHMQDQNKELAGHQANIGKILKALVDPDSGINRRERAIERDPLKGAQA